MGKLFRFRAPKIKITRKGLKVTKPSARIGGKVGVNVSSKGVSGSAQTKVGTYNTKSGFTFSLGRLFGFGKKKEKK